MNKPPAAQAPAAAAATEYVVRVPKASRRRFNMMRFHQALGVDFKTWTATKMERENNQKEFRSIDDEMPKFGAGSEYGRDQREEARRKKYGINMRRYVSENQPWLLTVGAKENRKKFKGIREGGVSENSSWYVFMQGKDGAFEAFPVEEWYNFKMIQRYNTLTAEEAEEQFEKRDKIMNFHALRWEKKLKQDVEDPDEEEKGAKKTKKTKSLLISELDDWMSSGESEEGEGEDGESKSKKKKGFKKGSKKRTQKGGNKRKDEDGDTDDDCFEESDEYDEMAEHEYISSDSSDSDAENEELVRKELAGVAEEDALKKLLNSDESSEDEEKKKEREKEEKKDKEEEEGGEKEKEKKKKKKKKKEKKEQKDSDGDSSSEEDKKEKKKKKGGDAGDKDEGGKRKMKNQAGDGAQNKKLKPDGANGDAGASGSGAAAAALPPPGSESGVTEEAIRRYLMRKPMTTIELLQKFKNKKTGLSSDQLVRAIAAILKRINPIKQMVKGKMYLSFKQV